MHRPFASLALFYIRSVYGLPAFARRKRGPRDAAAVPAVDRADRTDPAADRAAKRAAAKRALKSIGVGLLFLLVAADLALLFGASYASMYAALKPAGLQSLLLLNAATSASMFLFVVGFVTAISTYFLSQAEAGLLALPIKPRVLLAGKLAMVYLADFALAFLVMAVAAVVYGVNEGSPPSFYLRAVLVALSLPLVPLAAAYLLIVPFMSVARGARNKNLLVLVGGVFGIFAGLGFNIYIQRGAARLGDPAWIVANIAGPETLLARFGGAYPPARLAATALAAPAAEGALNALACLAMGLAAAGLVAFLLGPAYARSLVGFGEASFRRLRSAGTFIARVMRRRPHLEALFLREWRLMNRDPSYFLNGPFIVFMMPVIFAVMAFARREALADIQGLLAGLAGSPYPMLAAAAFGSFLGTGTSIACTALSRDAKALPYLKALPLPYASYMLAKLLHGLAFAGLGALIGAGGGALVLGLGAWQTLGAVATALSFAALVNLAGLWLDTANPRLSWDNPLAALKQNPNSVILILSDMGALAGLGVLSTRLPLGAGAFVALYGGGSALLFGLLLAAYPRYAERRIAAIEA